MPELNRDEVLALLPWYAAGGLDASQAQRVAEWLAQHGADDADDAEVRAELEWLKLTAAQVKESVDVPPADQGLDVLMRRVRAQAGAEASASVSANAAAGPEAAAANAGAWARLRSVLGFGSPSSGTRRGWGLAMAGVVLVQAAMIVALWWPPQDGGQAPLSDPRLPALRDATLWQITFVASATEIQVRQALQQAHASLVAGPGAVGVYTVAVPRATAPQAVAGLRALSNVVESVLPLPATPASPDGP